ncbi:hypothetical protein [Aliiroseovarius sp. F20344]|uniref:hypothetical protein n=1 Tax=Aliiroseovarius sp. F20344 TaxID=2926414 RepID=UPI001FF3F007|nr:hypothetical protein [Aliiroseovarius sp. F20344]MCK0141446.1 hypothetical protein [Aliiroseovarius sp. F20344]
MLSRNLKILVTIITVVVLPSAAALTWYAITKDPTIRPLGITKRALEQRGSTGGTGLIILIQYDPVEHAIASEALGKRIIFAFEAKGVAGEVKLRRVQGHEMSVTYIVGASTIGPFRASQATRGINAAAGAYRMNMSRNETDGGG